MTPDLDRLERLAHRATPGPWPVERAGDFGAPPSWLVECASWREHRNGVSFGEDEATARYVAALPPEVLLELLGRLRAQEERIHALEERLGYRAS